jgi:hypothetical protein
LAEELTYLRIGLMIISVVIIGAIVKVRKDQRTGNQFFVVMILFWFAVFLSAFRPEILDDIVDYTGLFNKSQVLLIFSIVIIMYLLTLQLLKNKSITFNFHRIVRNAAISNFQQQTMNSNADQLELMIVMAAKNESKTIGDVIDQINSLKLPYSYKILVVNDGSTDDTGIIAKKKGALVINHFQNLGIGGATKTGYVCSLFFKPEIVITIDSDGQHDPKYIPEIVSMIKSQKIDLVYTSRFSTIDYKTTKIRSVGNKFYTNLVNKLGKISITDVTSGYRGIRFEKIESVFFISETNFAIEFAIRAGRNGLKISEIPAKTVSRDFGTSQFHKIEKFFVYNINAVIQIFNAFFRGPKFIEIDDSIHLGNIQ